MLLREVVGGERLRRSGTISSPSSNVPSRAKKDATFLAQGRQGMVLSRSKKINMVTKLFGFNDQHDGYLRFLQLAIQHQDNPYIPRVSNLRLYDKQYASNYMDDRYEQVGAVDIEKLLPLSNRRIATAVAAKLAMLGVTRKASINEDGLWYNYTQALKVGEITRDEQFEEAIKLIDSLGGQSDLHMGNIMVRLTSTGPQLVLVDPIWEP